MGTKYFNEWEEKQAHSWADINPLEAKLKYEEYLKNILKIILHMFIMHLI